MKYDTKTALDILSEYHKGSTIASLSKKYSMTPFVVNSHIRYAHELHELCKEVMEWQKENDKFAWAGK